MIFFNLLVIILMFYGYKIISFENGLKKNKRFTTLYPHGASVVIAVRNEQNNIDNLVACLDNQTHPNLEIIFVDDESSDNTVNEIKKFSHLKLLHSSGGKKQAIKKGISAAKNSIILTTDGDCFLNKFWAEKMLAPFINQENIFVFGPVLYRNEINFFHKIQSLEFLSLIITGAGAAGENKAFICNGANLAFRKNVYEDSFFNIASGDDVFLLHQLKQKSKKINFIFDINAVVYTEAKNTLKLFLEQRKRWSSKSLNYIDKDAQIISWLVFLTNLFLILILFLGTKNQIITSLIIKFLIDFPILKNGAYMFKKERLLNYVLPLFLFYPFYIIYVAIVSQITNFEWKDRKYKR